MIKPGSTILDIGSGSGYMTACLAEAIGKEGKIYSIDHIGELSDFAQSNIQKNNKELLERIVFLT